MSQDDVELARMEDTFAARLSAAIAADVAAHPPNGALQRLVLRWHVQDDPMYFTLHALGTGDGLEAASGDEAWAPLEWAECDREFERTDRVIGTDGLAASSEALAAIYEQQIDEILDRQEAGEVIELGPGGDVSRAILETVGLLPEALRKAGVSLDPAFAAIAQDFEGCGAFEVLQLTAPASVVELLRTRGELPLDY